MEFLLWNQYTTPIGAYIAYKDRNPKEIYQITSSDKEGVYFGENRFRTYQELSAEWQILKHYSIYGPKIYGECKYIK